MKTIIGAMALVLTTAAAGPALAQVQPPQERINTAIARARQVGVPVALLESKVAEGKAKGVSLERIAAVVERRQAALERVSQALRGQPDVSAADLSVGADAVEAGVSDAVLRAVAETAPRDRRAVAIAVLTQLVDLGHGSEEALARVRDALKRGPDALANLPAQAGAANGRGNGPSNEPGNGNGNGRGNSSPGPPASVPAPGGKSQPNKPGGPPNDPGGRPSNPGRGGN